MSESKTVPPLRVLVADDETNLRESLMELVESEGFSALPAENGVVALACLQGAAPPDLVLLDLRMPQLDGLGVLRALRATGGPEMPVIVISAFGDSATMIEAMRLGAYDYITKPLDIDEITAILQRAAGQRRLSQATRPKPAPTTAAPVASSIIGTSRAMRDVFKQIGRISATDATVLVTGESGTGKELVARAIHEHSARSHAPFVAVNCGALPENLIESELFGHERGAFTGAERQRKGRFESAHGGTLLLDEVGELTPGAQVKLLRALQERRFERVGGNTTISVDVRVIAATNRDLLSEVEARRFREDLYYRLSVIELHLPALRERLADVPQLSEYFLERAVAKHHLGAKSFSEQALRALLNYAFPGNVRELENIVERAVVTAGSDVLLPEHLFAATSDTPAPVAGNAPDLWALPFKEAVAALEKGLIQRALEETQGNRSEAAKRLGINRRLLYSKLEEHHLA